MLTANLNPLWNESFVFYGTAADFRTSGLTLQVFDHDFYARDELLGDVHVQLSELEHKRRHEYVLPLRVPAGREAPSAGTIFFSATYVPPSDGPRQRGVKQRSETIGEFKDESLDLASLAMHLRQPAQRLLEGAKHAASVMSADWAEAHIRRGLMRLRARCIRYLRQPDPSPSPSPNPNPDPERTLHQVPSNPNPNPDPGRTLHQVPEATQP